MKRRRSDRVDNPYLSPQDLREMTEISKERLTLAYIGDAVLEIGVMASIWSPQEPQKIPLNEFLHNERNKLVENEPLSRFWDSLELAMIHRLFPIFLPKTVKQKVPPWKLVFGIIFLEGGLDAVEMSLQNLKKYYERTK